jgi:hypothetical protein
LKLTVNYGTHNVETETACESFVWHDTTYTTSGTYTHAYTNNDGCASVDTLKLTVNYGTHNVETETACESYVWHDSTYTESGTYTYAYTNNDGCASVDTLKLTINPSYEITVYDTTVREHEYTFGDFTIVPMEAGTFSYDLQYSSNEGCDSVIHLIITVLNGDDVPSIEISKIEVFPNPAYSSFNIKGENMRRIDIYNTDGQLIYSSDSNNENLIRVNVSQYAAGQYFITVYLNNGHSVNKKIIISK